MGIHPTEPAPDEPTLTISAAGTGEWRLPNGDLHRSGGPALKTSDGTFWFEYGVPHRADGPAADYHLQRKQEWWVRGNLHRLDGPAITYLTGKPSWYVRGERIIAPVETSVLNDLYLNGHIDDLTQVLSLWRPDGPSVADLLSAVRDAAA